MFPNAGRRRPLREEDAFTFGREELNPALVRKLSKRRRSGGSSGDGQEAHSDSEPDDDNIPLSFLPSVRVRRGSEGYEIKPMSPTEKERAVLAYQRRLEAATRDAGEESAHLDVNSAGRYDRYEAEPGSDGTESYDGFDSSDSGSDSGHSADT